MIDPNLPLIDLHRHLDGNVRLETILDLGRKYDLPLPAWSVEGLKPHVRVTDPQPGVMAFIAKFEWMVGVLVNPDDCQRIAYENVEDAYQEGLDYVELRFSPKFMAQPHQLDLVEVVDAVIEGIQKGRQDFPIKVNLLGIISRTFGPEDGWHELQALLTRKEDLVALDLAGDEKNYPGEQFVEHIERGREAGWKITIHAGEEAGPESIWQAIDGLGADRIGHGISAVRDPELVDALRERKIGLEINLTSNYQTNVVPSLADHPLRELLSRGVLATINTDDPGISGIDIHHEYQQAAPAAGLSVEQIRQAQKNALQVAFIDDVEREVLLEKKRGSGRR